MDDERIDPGLRKFIDKKIGMQNHQMRLQRQARHPPERVDNRWSHGKVGDEMPVHHVHMDAICSGALGLRNLIAQMSEISGENRRRELHCICRHVALLSLR
jgi:hypothetical protein